MAVTIILNRPAIERLLHSPEGDIPLAIRKIGLEVQANAKIECPVDNGTLRASIFLDMDIHWGRVAARVGTPLFYGRYVHDGTGIYAGRPPIRPVRARVLHFHWAKKGGVEVFAHQVRGMQGTPFLVRGLVRGCPFPVNVKDSAALRYL